MTSPTVRRATAEDAGVLGVISPAAYAEAYGYLWDRPDAYAEQLQTFSSDAFKQLLCRPDVCVWVSETGGTVVGFLSMIIGSIDPVEHRPGGAELPRIYILGPAQRIGLGQVLLNAAIRHATIEGLSHTWLDVMTSADQARRAYLRWGFREIGSRVFGKPVRPDLSNMVVMSKELRAS